MKILFDQGTPVPLRKVLSTHDVSTVFELDWSTLKNGELISKAESEGFQMLITTDKNLKYQQNLSGMKIAILVLGTTSWPKIKTSISKIQHAITEAGDVSYIEVEIP